MAITEGATDLHSRLTTNRIYARTAEVEIEGVGTVTVRALSRHEVLEAGKINDALKAERYTLSRAMLDPPMTEEDVARWQRASLPSEINLVAMKVNELSGVYEGAAKSPVDEIRE